MARKLAKPKSFKKPKTPAKKVPKNPECMLHIHYEYITIYYH